ncbi:SDR family NAD(P)-dependent oxidoreductase [Xanthobacter sp. V3C-3]|uniref:SDR family NAD(P)-dependent oxidoreductase n=1 Tax=Xanthobacter lutulentifluminis TaxID=3119935 RepID=UPI00372B650E
MSSSIATVSSDFDIAVIGQACRLPGARSIEALARLLRDGRNCVQDAPVGRWPVERALHPRRSEPGFSYTFAGGYLDDPFSFDPAVFGISPREAQQIDPQQRLLLEVVWEALEDAGIAPSRTAGQDIGVYVGASNVDYQSGAAGDPAAIESHFMTGNSLSIISNRISYIFDWRGPSFTVDSACSSSFVALVQAAAALRAGLIDTAVVAGVNLLLSPAPFIGFSRASMLSPTGRCRPFSAGADGYVRAEGAIALVLRRTPDARAAGQSIHAEIVGAAANSDGRTSGISLPSVEGQAGLMRSLYGAVGIAADRVAFVEAHGTGTPVGDPIEANAIGAVLGAGRATPLPVGSVKSNIGHLECVSGLAGLVKASLALRERRLPRTLFLEELSPHIDFAALNLLPARDEIALDLERTPFAGICNYGFGGTNAHVILRAPEARDAPAAGTARMLLLSARSRQSLRDLAASYAQRMEQGDAPAPAIAAAAFHQRELMDVRLAVPVTDAADMAAALRSFAREDAPVPGLAIGKAQARHGKTVFVYSGNGAQWVGMGRAALARNACFREAFAAVDQRFQALAGWSLAEALAAPDLATRLGRTSVAQPLLFAIQAALTAALKDEGITPDIVLGHSVGEVAAALASGALDLDAAVHLIHHRSHRQESVAGAGRMIALAAGAEQADAFVETLGAPGLVVAAYNGPHSVTLSGPEASIVLAEKAARLQRLATVALDIAYPFHSSLLDPAADAIREDLKSLAPAPTQVVFISTVTGGPLVGTDLDADYWWRNIRLPVRFEAAVAAAGALGGTHFVEIGPRPILTGATSETLRTASLAAECVGSLSERDDQSTADPVRELAARLVTRGLAVDTARCFGAPPAPLALPHYAWDRQRYVLPTTSEAIELFGRLNDAPPPHPLLGLKVSAAVPEWHNCVDAEIVPYLADHRVDGEAVVPGAALAEMMLAVGRSELGNGPLELSDFDILRPLALADGSMREVSTRYEATTRTCEIWSRHRLGGGAFVLHATGRLSPATGRPLPPRPPAAETAREVGGAEVYAAAERCGLDYGPSFRRVLRVLRDADCGIADLAAGSPPLGAYRDSHLIDPTALDAALHILFLDAEAVEGETRTHLPVRFGALRVWQPGVAATHAIMRRQRRNRFTAVIDLTLLAHDGSVVAEAADVVLREVVLAQRPDDDRQFRVEIEPVRSAGATAPLAPLHVPPETPDAALVLRAFVRSFTYECVAAPDIQARLHAPEGRLAVALDYLRACGLANRDAAAGWRLDPTPPLPSQVIYRTLLERFADANAEIRLAAQLMASLPGALADGAGGETPAPLVELFETDAHASRSALGLLGARIEERIATCAPRAPRILVASRLGAGLLSLLLPLARAERIRVSLVGAGAAECERLAALPCADAFDILDRSAEDFRLPPIDLVVGLATGPADLDVIERTLPLAPGAAVALAAPLPDPALALLLGAPDLAEAAELRAPAARALEEMLARLGCEAIASAESAGGLSTVVSGALPPPPPENAAPLPLWIVGHHAPGFAQALAGDGDSIVDGVPAAPVETAPGALVLPAAFDPATPAREGLAAVLLELRALIAFAQGAGCALWVVTAGARPRPEVIPDPSAVALSAFCRVAMNEHPGLDLRLVDVDAFDAAATDRVRRLIARPGEETERVSRPAGECAVRVRRGAARPMGRIDADTRTRLHVGRQGVLGAMEWRPEPRVAPGEGEIEIEIAATGLNFRDVMLALGALDDDILGPGLTGASLGFEMAGHVVRVGPGVTDHRIGDRVMGFAPHAFASHVTVPAWFAFKVPDGLDTEAAAGIPVAFATAWYALIDRARLTAGETVLIHGGAGGVGLAAVGIAHARGARVIATAGTAEKAALLKALGVEWVYNSRDLAFAQDIALDHGKVDVVLNSLAGDAMTASLRLVKPFGRFVELGKRDFLANTTVGLRPFARNISYFGVDLDQLLAHDRGRATALMSEIGAAFAEGALHLSPYRVLEGPAVEEAFRQMQAARHVGKIVVRPASTGWIAPAAPQAPVFPEGVYLVVGGNGGFGLETALWLAARVPGTVAIASRSGVRAPEDLARIDAARAAGARIEVEQADARDAAALEALVERLVAEHGPLRGIVHTAMVLRDGAIANLDADSLDAVLAPKIDGVLALDRITERHPVAHFVVYSSASAMIGSPGQGAYVAANAFLEGVVRARRARGLPGLALAWGAIADAGVIARDQELGQRLSRATGVAGITSEEALGFLGRLMAAGPAAEPVNVYAQVNRTAIASQLPVLKTPTFPRLFAAGADDGSGGGEDLLEQLAGLDDAEARARLREVLAREVAAILRLPAEAVSGTAVLSELGMDSLMALELRLTLEKKFRFELPLLSIGSGRTLDDLAAVALASLRPAEGKPSAAPDAGPRVTPAVTALAVQHGVGIDAQAMDTFVELASDARGSTGTAP